MIEMSRLQGWWPWPEFVSLPLISFYLWAISMGAQGVMSSSSLEYSGVTGAQLEGYPRVLYCSGLPKFQGYPLYSMYPGWMPGSTRHLCPGG